MDRQLVYERAVIYLNLCQRLEMLSANLWESFSLLKFNIFRKNNYFKDFIAKTKRMLWRTEKYKAQLQENLKALIDGSTPEERLSRSFTRKRANLRRKIKQVQKQCEKYSDFIRTEERVHCNIIFHLIFDSDDLKSQFILVRSRLEYAELRMNDLNHQLRDFDD